MRVPTYQSQGKRTTEVSARQLNVRANPGALAAESQALANFGQTAAKVGQTWYEQSLKAERAGQLKSAENQLAKNYGMLRSRPLTRTQRMSQHSMSKRRRLPSQPSLAASRTLSCSATQGQCCHSHTEQERHHLQRCAPSRHRSEHGELDTRIDQRINTIATGGRAEAHAARVELWRHSADAPRSPASSRRWLTLAISGDRHCFKEADCRAAHRLPGRTEYPQRRSYPALSRRR